MDKSIINNDGIAKTKISEDVDVAVIKSDGSESLVFLNLKYLNSGYGESGNFEEVQPSTKYFAFTDRPIYKPGDTVKFKSIMRADLDADYKIFSGEIKAEVYTGYGQNKTIVYTDKFNIDNYGAVDGEFIIPKSAKTGNYTINLKKEGEQAVTSRWGWGGYTPSANINFLVEHYRKPEYTLDIDMDYTKVIAGSDLKFKIKGSYFSGQPLNNKQVSYTVKRRDYYESPYLEYFKKQDNSYHYGYYYGKNTVKTGVVDLNEEGMAEVVLNDVEKDSLKGQVYIIEAKYIDSTQNQVIARKNALVLGAEFGIFRVNRRHNAQVGRNVDVEFKIVPYDDNKNVNERELKVNIARTEWVCTNGYWSCKKNVEGYPEKIITTDSDGRLILNFEKIKKGSYSIKINLEDDKGNKIEKSFNFWVGDYYHNYDNNMIGGLSIIADKEEYKAGEDMNIKVFSKIEDRDVFVSIERDWVKRFNVIKIRSGEANFKMPVEIKDIPNVRISASGFSDFNLDRAIRNVNVSAEKYLLDVEIKADKDEYGPSDTVRLDILTKDINGNGVSTESTIWLVDKALFELADDNTGNIFDKFWSVRNSYTSMSHSLKGLNMDMAEKGGCFSADTEILMQDNKIKSISQVSIGDKILTFANKENKKLVKAEVVDVHNAVVDGYLIINENLKITPNHILMINNDWNVAGLIQIGDYLRNSNGEKQKVYSVEWQKGKFEVYNLEIRKYHTFIANNIWVHNDKGGGTRSVFEDAAYWNPSVKTDKNGRASVTFKLPDNLTTWVISAVAATLDTKVGQTKKDLLVTKDIFIEPVLPNILRTGDSIIVSAIVNNYSDIDREFFVDLEFDSGRVASSSQKIVIKSKGFKQINWSVFPEKENEQAVIRFSALDINDDEIGDIIEIKIPVKEFGFWQTKSFSGNGNQNYQIDLLATSSKQAKINLTLSLSAEGPIMSAMDYLVGYPYGCMEQTTSQFVPAVIAKENEKIFKQKLFGKDLDKMIMAGIDRLANFQNNDGGWAWWNSDQSEIALSAYIFEYVLKAKNAGVDIDESVLEKASNFFRDIDLNSYTKYGASSKNEAIAYRNYVLVLLGDKIDDFNEFENLDVESLSYAIMANSLAGHSKSANIGIEELLSKSKTDGKYIYWIAGNSEKYGSRNASNAMAIRALLSVKYESGIIHKAAGYLLENRGTRYWSNTYGTARVIQALVDYLVVYQMNESNRYFVYLDDIMIDKGVIDKNNSFIELNISESDIKNSGSELRIEQEEKTKIYSTLVIENFNSDAKAKAISNGVSIDRVYQNEKGVNYSIGIGDVVEISLKVNGFGNDRKYAIIEDFLPAGMIPINTTLKNESGRNSYSRWYWYGDKDYKKDGIQVYLRYPRNGARTIKYKARVVNSGIFQVPPAHVSYMYSPEISGMSDAQTLEIEENSREMEEIKEWAIESFSEKNVGIIRELKIKKAPIKKYYGLLFPIIMTIIGIVYLVREINKNKRDDGKK